MCKLKSGAVSILVTLFLLTGTGCKKGYPLLAQRFCWQVIDNFGSPMQEVCNKTEAEMKARYNSCNYYKNSGEKACWWADGMFLENMTKEGADLHVRCFWPNAGAAVKVACHFCQTFYHRRKMTYKPANTITYSPVSRERFCGDTSATLYHRRQVILKDTPDSLIVLQFSNNGSEW